MAVYEKQNHIAAHFLLFLKHIVTLQRQAAVAISWFLRISEDLA